MGDLGKGQKKVFQKVEKVGYAKVQRCERARPVQRNVRVIQAHVKEYQGIKYIYEVLCTLCYEIWISFSKHPFLLLPQNMIISLVSTLSQQIS